jgi:hypothetical protein
LLLASNPARVVEAELPAWVSEWIAKREASAEKKAVKAEPEAESPETAAKRDADRQKRAVKREERVRAGLAELQTWIGDLLRQGLAQGKQQPAQFFDAMAARMVDAQAPGVARRLRGLPGLFASGEGWADRTLEEVGTLQWLLHGFANLDALPDGLRASVRNAIGWNVAEQELVGNQPVRDRWQVAGQIVEEEEKLRVQRTWLIGETSRQPALILSFAAMNQPVDVSLIAGTVVEADVVFYPSPLRALVVQRHGEAHVLKEPAAHANFSEALDQTATLLVSDPWLERTPWLVRDCVPIWIGEKWLLRDVAGALVPLARTFQSTWPLVAVSGGAPVTIFGEWNGHALLPLSVFTENRFIPLGGVLA